MTLDQLAQLPPVLWHVMSTAFLLALIICVTSYLNHNRDRPERGWRRLRALFAATAVVIGVWGVVTGAVNPVDLVREFLGAATGQ